MQRIQKTKFDVHVLSDGPYRTNGYPQVSVSLTDVHVSQFLSKVEGKFGERSDVVSEKLQMAIRNFEEVLGVAPTSDRFTALAVVNQAVRMAVTYAESGTDASRVYNKPYITSNNPAPIGYFLEHGVARCREMTILSHLAFAQVGVESDIMSVSSVHVWIETQNIVPGLRLYFESTNGMVLKPENAYRKFDLAPNSIQKIVVPVKRE